jgi:hypothetical protein
MIILFEMLECDAQHRFDSQGISVELLDGSSAGMRNLTLAPSA